MFKTRALAALLAIGTAVAIVAPASSSSAATIPQGLATVVACPSGLSAYCVEYRYGFSVPNSTGQLGIYYTVRYSSSRASFKVERVKWVNNTSRTVFFGGYGVHSLEHAFGFLGFGGSPNAYSVLSGQTWTYNESSFTGADAGFWYQSGRGAYAVSDENDYTWQYHNASNVPVAGGAPFLLG